MGNEHGSFYMDKNNYSGSEKQGENSMESGYDKSNLRQGSCGGEASVVDTKVGYEHLLGQPSTSRSEDRKRRYQSSHPFAENTSGRVLKVEPQPLEDNLRVQELELRKIKTETSSEPDVAMEPYAKSIKVEPPFIQTSVKREDKSEMASSNDGEDNSKASIPCASAWSDEIKILVEIMKSPNRPRYVDFSEVGAHEMNLMKKIPSGSDVLRGLPQAKSMEEELTCFQRPVKREDESEMLSSNDGKERSTANISPASTSSDEVEILKEVLKPEEQVVHSPGYFKCDVCGERFTSKKHLYVHLNSVHKL